MNRFLLLFNLYVWIFCSISWFAMAYHLDAPLYIIISFACGGLAVYFYNVLNSQ
jgi:hypothetical protein